VSAAIEAFHSKYAEDIRSALERLNLSADDVADVTQTMFQELLLGREAGAPTLASYVGRGSLGAWIRVSATRKGLGVLRRSPICATGDDEILEAQVPEADLELAYMRSLYGEAFRKAFLTAMAALDSRDKNFLRQHFIDGLTIDDLARAHLVHRATAARWIQRARTRLLEETRREFARQSEVSPLECESVLRLLQSRLDVTWRRLLA
jgi:RNA polymerase sigma-70 factor (ECF subfamily)